MRDSVRVGISGSGEKETEAHLGFHPHFRERSPIQSMKSSLIYSSQWNFNTLFYSIYGFSL